MIKDDLKDIFIIYNKNYCREAEIVKKEYKNIFSLIEKLWGLKKSSKYGVYILDSFMKYIFSYFPVKERLMLLLTLPFWYFKIRRKWKKWMGVSNTNHVVKKILVKPIISYSKLDYGFSELLFYNENDPEIKFKSVLCQELLYLFSSYLNIPSWLNYGISLVTINKYIGKKIIRTDTINILREYHIKEKNINNIRDIDDKKIAYNYAKGYWTVRYLEKNYPGFLKESFKKKDLDIEKEIAEKIGISTDKESFWSELDEFLYNYFKDKLR
jgi:hypothetical protein